MEKLIVRTSISITQEERDRWKEHADNNWQSLSSYIRKAVNYYERSREDETRNIDCYHG